MLAMSRGDSATARRALAEPDSISAAKYMYPVYNRPYAAQAYYLLGDYDAAEDLAVLAEGIEKSLAELHGGSVEIRSAGLGAWSPDFSIYRGSPGDDSVCLLGAHYFREPPSPLQRLLPRLRHWEARC